ncbi:MAG: penicillin-binding protein 2 [bacterium]|nr:penicillin-binding protein 2 [bacterium]
MPFFEKYLVKRPRQELEPHEVFIDRLVQKKERDHGTKEMKFEVPPPSKATVGFLFFALLCLSILFAKTFQLTVIKGKTFSELASRNFSRISPIRADRGVVYDKNYEKLVSNLPSFDLILEKRDLPENQGQKETREIAAVLGIDASALWEKISQAKEETIIVSENLNHDILVVLETKINDWPGFKIEKNTVRDYADGPVFSQILGYTGRINSPEFSDLKDNGYFVSDYLGKQGLEKSYEKTLRGVPGIFEVQKDAIGAKIQEGIKSQPEAGQNLVLWLDAELQRKLYSELSRIAQENGRQKGAEIAMDPKTGSILALVSLPSFNNNLFSQGGPSEELDRILNNPRQPLFNRAISGQYASGSTIKPLMASAALQEKIISPDKQIYSRGFISVVNQYYPDIVYTYGDTAPAGWVDMRKAIAISCNVYFYTIGGGYLDQKGLGSTKIKNYLNLFNWGKTTGIDLPQESQGLIPDHQWKEKNIEEIWYVGDTYNMSIGQGYLQVSPLQVVTAFSAIANNGRIMKPQMVAKIIEGPVDNPKIIKEFSPQTISELPIDKENLQIVREGMRDAVIYGSSAILADLPVKAASKTGTAQTPKADYYHNWVTVFAPYDDPQIVLTVLIEDVPGVRAAALPVANEVLKWYFGR